METSIFSRRADALLSRDERAELIGLLAAKPEAGDLIPGLRGIRKLRFSAGGRGKSGAFRVIYYVATADLPILALFLYGKNEQSNPTQVQSDARAAPSDARRSREPEGGGVAQARLMEEKMADKTAQAKRVDVTDELIAALEEGAAIMRGETAPARVWTPPAGVNVRATRDALGLSQTAFARRFGFSAAAVREWEQGRRQPEAAARTLLLVIAHNPEAVDEAIRAGSPKAA